MTILYYSFIVGLGVKWQYLQNNVATDFFMLIDLKTYKKLIFFNFTQNSGFAPRKNRITPKTDSKSNKKCPSFECLNDEKVDLVCNSIKK